MQKAMIATHYLESKVKDDHHQQAWNAVRFDNHQPTAEPRTNIIIWLEMQ